MRLVLLIALGVCTTACFPTATFVKRTESLGVIDFRGLSADGFFISPNPYSGPHSSLGLIFVTAQAGGSLVERSDDQPYRHWRAEQLGPDSVMAIAKQRAITMGADGLVNVTIEAAPREIGGGAYPAIQASGWRVSGLAIKRGATSASPP
jgi:hypothetical protein